MGISNTIFKDYVKSGKYSKVQLYVLKDALQRGVDTSKFDNPEYSAGQMSILLSGIESNIDVSEFAKPTMSEEVMNTYLCCLMYGVDPKPYFERKFKCDQILEIAKAIRDGIDPALIANRDYGSEFMKVLRYNLCGKSVREAVKAVNKE